MAPVVSGGGTTVIVQPSNPVIVGNDYGGYGGGSSGYSGGELALGKIFFLNAQRMLDFI